MKTISAILSCAIGILVMSSCTKSSQLEEKIGLDTKSEIDLASYFQYETNDPMLVIKLADSNYYNDLVKRMSSRQADGPYFEIDYSGIFWECGDGSATCIAPQAPCAVIICQDIQSSGDIVTYTDADMIKYFAEGPQLVSYSSIIADKSPNQQSCSSNSIVNTSFVFEE